MGEGGRRQWRTTGAPLDDDGGAVCLLEGGDGGLAVASGQVVERLPRVACGVEARPPLAWRASSNTY